MAGLFGQPRADSPRTGSGRVLPGPLAAARPSYPRLIPFVEYNSPMLWQVEYIDGFGESWQRRGGQLRVH